MKKIIIFYPYNKRALDQETVALFLNDIYEVHFITIETRGDIHKHLESKGINTSSLLNNKNFLINISFFYYFYLLIKFSYLVFKIKPKVVFSHLEVPGLISVTVNFFLPFKNYYFRHNADAHIFDGNYKARIANYIVNYLSKKIICVTQAVYNYVKNIEKISSKKLFQIDYCYNFTNFIDNIIKHKEEILNLRESYDCDFLFLSVGRLVPLKRHRLAIELIKKLNHINSKKYILLILGEGNLLDNLKDLVEKLRLQEYVYFLGFKKNTFKYYGSVDALIHFSSSESLGHVVSEAGIAKKLVIVCKNVGIFNELIIDNLNGFLVDKNNPVIESVEKIISSNLKDFEKMGKNLHETINQKFNIKFVKDKYINLIENDK